LPKLIYLISTNYKTNFYHGTRYAFLNKIIVGRNDMRIIKIILVLIMSVYFYSCSNPALSSELSVDRKYDVINPERDDLKISNEIFTIRGDVNQSEIKELQLKIFNSDNDLIHASESYSTPISDYSWNGISDWGETAPDGEYFASVTLVYLNGKTLIIPSETFYINTAGYFEENETEN
jgi:CHU_C Type IX secretion signal domain